MFNLFSCVVAEEKSGTTTPFSIPVKMHGRLFTIVYLAEMIVPLFPQKFKSCFERSFSQWKTTFTGGLRGV